MLIPMIFMRIVEKMMKSKPPIAEVIISLAVLILSGLPAEVVIMKRP